MQKCKIDAFAYHEPVTIHDIKMHYEERPQVLDALEKELINVDAVEWVLDCE